MIPGDIMNTAHSIVDTYGAGSPIERKISHAIVIARALLAERERCAQIAENNDYFPSEGAAIAAAIRNA